VGSEGSGDAPLACAAADRAGEGRLRIAASEEHEIAVESAHCEWSLRLLQLVDR
jgi:NAD(P)H-hydrate repair Nnr-like enzyme with NAD(P)H-hydrate dehydratase domain